MKNFISRSIATALTGLVACFQFTFAAAPYQVPNAGFEETAGNYEGVLQPATWHLSNVEQVGMKFAIGSVSTDAHSGNYSVLCNDKEVGAMGITEVSPSWVTYGTPWAYLEGLSTGTATAGTTGGISWTARPDTMGVWLKRVTNNGNEDMNLVYYSWTGTATNNKYKNKNAFKDYSSFHSFPTFHILHKEVSY